MKRHCQTRLSRAAKAAVTQPRPVTVDRVLKLSVCGIAASVAFGLTNASAQYQITTLGTPVTENFSGYAGTSAPTNWVLNAVNSSNASSQAGFQGNQGNSNTGGWRSYGATGSTDRSLGYLGNGNFGSTTPATMTASFQNSTGSALTSLAISYTGEQWLAQQSRTSFITFSYSLDGTTFIPVSDMTFNAPNTAATATTGLNGDAAGNRETLSYNLNSGLVIADGTTFYLRWSYNGGASSGSRQGLSIDNISVTGNGTVSAGDLYWNGGSWGATGPGAGGNGTWNDGAGAWDSVKKAVFGGSAGTVTVGTVTASDGMEFNTSGYVLNGGTIDLGGAIDTAHNGVTTINSAITGTSGLTKVGTGALVLSGSNTFSGDVNVAAGILRVAADEAFGAATNGVSVSGTLNTTASFTLGADRTLSGNGTIDIDAGTTLTVAGNVNMGALTLTNVGTLDLQGGGPSLGNLTFKAAATITGADTLSLTGLNATDLTSGTATIAQAISFSTAGDKVVDVGSGGTLDLQLSVNLQSSSVRLHKTGEGTLILGTGIGSGGVRLGTAGSVTGGTLIVKENDSLGTLQTHLNHGTLVAENAAGILFNNGISLGGRVGSVAVLAGDAMTFSGTSGLFQSAGITNRMDVNNHTTFAGVFTGTGTTLGSGLILGGSGTAVFNGEVTMAVNTSVTDSLTVVVNSNWNKVGAGGGIAIGANATLKGNGTIYGLIQMSGIHAVGNSAGIQTAAGGISYLSGAAFEWELGGNSNATAGVDFDQLVVSGGNISIDSNVTMQLVFDSTGSTVDWTDSFWDTDHTWTIVDNTGGGLLTGQFLLNPSSEWFDANGLLLSAVDPDAQFVLSTVGGDVVLTYYAVPVPEPSTLAFLGFAGAGLFWSRRRRSA